MKAAAIISAFVVAMQVQATGSALAETANPLTDTGSWVDLREDIVGDVDLLDGSSIIEVEAPYRANDAATVPIVIEQTNADAPQITSATLVVDENPAPVVAELEFGPAMHPLKMEMRVRVDQYSNVRLIASNSEGTYMDGRFVKASGGCSAPATRDPEVALESMGLIKVRHFGEQGAMSLPRREAQIMIRHPNYSGLQRDQITQLFISAHFINRLEVFQGDELLFKLEGGISISENPVFRFDYSDNGSPDLTVRAEDTDGNVFEETLPKGVQS